MIKEIIDKILLAEQQAESIEHEASKRAQEIRINANNKAEEYLENSRKDTKDAIRQIMLKASADGEKQAAETVGKRSEANEAFVRASRKNHEEAVCRIITEFLNSNNL